MYRKLTHSIRALAVSFGVFAAAVAIGIPAGLQTTPAATVLEVEMADNAAGATVAPAPKASAAKPAAVKHRQRRREARDEMSMPFFSFAHVLRRGNGS